MACRYELLDECMDHGYPQLTDPSVLKSLITQKGFKRDLAGMTDMALDLVGKVGACSTCALFNCINCGGHSHTTHAHRISGVRGRSKCNDFSQHMISKQSLMCRAFIGVCSHLRRLCCAHGSWTVVMGALRQSRQHCDVTCKHTTLCRA